MQYIIYRGFETLFLRPYHSKISSQPPNTWVSPHSPPVGQNDKCWWFQVKPHHRGSRWPPGNRCRVGDPTIGHLGASHQWQKIAQHWHCWPKNAILLLCTVFFFYWLPLCMILGKMFHLFRIKKITENKNQMPFKNVASHRSSSWCYLNATANSEEIFNNWKWIFHTPRQLNQPTNQPTTVFPSVRHFWFLSSSSSWSMPEPLISFTTLGRHCMGFFHKGISIWGYHILPESSKNNTPVWLI